MKNINKIIVIVGLLFCVLQPVSAQFRMGIDWSYGIPKSYTYYTHYYDDEENYMPTVHVGFSFEYVLPRRIMPLYLPLSIKSGVYYAHYEEAPLEGSEYYNYGDAYWGQGIGIPVVAEVKYLINNNIRVYANAGVTLNVLYLDYLHDREYEINAGDEFAFKAGGTVEAGIEFRNFRIGFGYRSLFSTFYGMDDEKKVGSGFISMGWRFGGNRLFKKTSKLNVY